MLKQILMATFAIVCGAAFAQDDLPRRKSGLWEMTTTDTAKSGQGASTMHMCIDQKTDSQWMQMGAGMSKEMCSKNEYKVEKNQIVSNSVCKFGQSTATTRAVFSGNYESAYRGDINSTYDPPFMGRKESKTVIEAKWVGPCKPGQKPGDMILPNGMTMNMNDMMKMKK